MFRTFVELPSDVKPIFKCLLDSTPLPERHLSVEAMTMKRHKSSARQSEADGSQNGYQDHVDDVDVTDY